MSRARPTAGGFALRTALSGLAGTTAMTVTTEVQRHVRSTASIPVDYDATRSVVQAAATVLRHEPRTDRQAEALFTLVHWGYGSAVAVLHTALASRLSRPRAAVLFYAACQAMAFALFPLLGKTPPPWRWRRDVLISSLAQHAVYVAVVSAVDHAVVRQLD